MEDLRENNDLGEAKEIWGLDISDEKSKNYVSKGKATNIKNIDLQEPPKNKWQPRPPKHQGEEEDLDSKVDIADFLDISAKTGKFLVEVVNLNSEPKDPLQKEHSIAVTSQRNEIKESLIVIRKSGTTGTKEFTPDNING